MKDLISNNPKMVGALLGMLLSGLLALVGIKMSDVCKGHVPVEAAPAVVEPAK